MDGYPCATDGLTCTADVCDAAGTCTHSLTSGCLISGACVTGNATDPANDCQECNPAKSTNGCPPPPPDRDGDGVADNDDACPDKPGVKSDDPQKNGCPELAVLTATEITINEQILFKINRAEIEPASEQILRAVATILTEHSELKIDIEGDTDNKGIRANNRVLSSRRAEAVRDWLVKAGIQATRLTSKGFGQDVPVDTNTTEEGRQKNRRVVFRIMSGGTDATKPSEKSIRQQP